MVIFTPDQTLQLILAAFALLSPSIAALFRVQYLNAKRELETAKSEAEEKLKTVQANLASKNADAERVKSESRAHESQTITQGEVMRGLLNAMTEQQKSTVEEREQFRKVIEDFRLSINQMTKSLETSTEAMGKRGAKDEALAEQIKTLVSSVQSRAEESMLQARQLVERVETVHTEFERGRLTMATVGATFSETTKTAIAEIGGIIIEMRRLMDEKVANIERIVTDKLMKETP